MAEFRMTFDDDEFQTYLRVAMKNIGNLRPIMVFAVSVMSKSAVANFRSGGRPPFRWAGLRPMTIKARRTEIPPTFPAGPLGQPILQRHGTLFQSMLQGNSNNITRVNKDSAEYGTILLKAPTLQFGAKERRGVARVPEHTRRGSLVKAHTRRFKFGRVPARPFLYFRAEDETKIARFAYAFAFNPDVARKFGKIPSTGAIPSNLFLGFG